MVFNNSSKLASQESLVRRNKYKLNKAKGLLIVCYDLRLVFTYIIPHSSKLTDILCNQYELKVLQVFSINTPEKESFPTTHYHWSYRWREYTQFHSWVEIYSWYGSYQSSPPIACLFLAVPSPLQRLHQNRRSDLWTGGRKYGDSDPSCQEEDLRTTRQTSPLKSLFSNSPCILQSHKTHSCALKNLPHQDGDIRIRYTGFLRFPQE